MKGTIALLPISYFPSISYLKVMNSYTVSIEANENYQKRTFRNRARILNANGSLLLSVPLKKGKTLTKIRETQISFADAWQSQHLKHLKSSYKSAPYYEHYIDELASLIMECPPFLWDLNLSILDYLSRLGYCQSWKLTEEYITQNAYEGVDFRTNRIILTESQKNYHQVFEPKFGFVKDLSCLDLLFNVGPEGPAYL